ncbi:MAG: glycine cleavage system protein GcvH [Candidatus Omnitrophica bacterium]|nr:glycine cleavage system protein GcvH [Candidatus Omnitrophota bacterium]
MEVMEDYFYTKEHEWVRIEDNIAIVGISEYAQSALGDITFVELPEVGLEIEQFEQFASVESVKAASDIYCPLSGVVIEVNEELSDSPDLINRDCYEKGWMVKIEISNLEDKVNLMTSTEYQKFLESLE